VLVPELVFVPEDGEGVDENNDEDEDELDGVLITAVFAASWKAADGEIDVGSSKLFPI